MLLTRSNSCSFDTRIGISETRNVVALIVLRYDAGYELVLGLLSYNG